MTGRRGLRGPDRTASALRLFVLALFFAVLAMLAFAPDMGPWPGASANQSVRISHATLSCPTALAGSRQVSLAGALVARSQAEPGGMAALQALSGADAGAGTLAAVTAVDSPATVTGTGGPQVPLVASGQGGWAAALGAGVAGRVGSGRGSGLYSAQCRPAGSQWWFVGVGSTLGRRDILVVSNPASEPARFDVILLGRDGPVSAVAGRGLEVAGNSQVALGMDALAPGEDLLAVSVTATAGQLAASITSVAAPVSDQPRGADYLPPVAAPDTEVVIAGVPAGKGARTLFLANPGDAFATAQVRALSSAGAVELPDLLTAAVPARSVVSIELDRHLKQRSATLQLTSDQPITGAVSATYGEQERDVLWLAATPMVAAPSPLAAAAAVPAGAGLAAQVTVAAPGEAVFGTLTVIAVGDGQQSPFRPSATVPRKPSPWRPLPADRVPVITTLRINVPAGTQRQLTLPAAEAASLLTLYWTADPGSAPAAVSHVVTATGADPMATGMQWWPTISQVDAAAVVADIGVLVPGQ